MSGRRPPPKGVPLPPVPGAGGGSLRKPVTGSTSFGGYRTQDKADFTEHASQIKDVADGRDIVEQKPPDQEKRPAAFDRQELPVVRAWVKNRPLEPTAPASTMIPYPRNWSTQRGRYTKFRLAGSGAYGLIRARPTF
jgi:hypothetical protein